MYLLGDMLSYNYNKLIKTYITQFSRERDQMCLVVYKRLVSTNPGLVTVATLFTFHLSFPVSTCIQNSSIQNSPD